jgi:hypothetical protein
MAKPTHRFVFKDKESGDYTTVGCVWPGTYGPQPQFYGKEDLNEEFGQTMTFEQALEATRAGDGYINIFSSGKKGEPKELY